MKKFLCLLATSLLLSSALPVSAAEADGMEPIPVPELVYSIEHGVDRQAHLEPGSSREAALAEGDNTSSKGQAEAALVEELLKEQLSAASLPPSKTANDAEMPKDRLLEYNRDTDIYRSQIESHEWQKAYSDRRSFAAFGRAYINRITCEGTISDVIFPTTKGLELEIKNQGHDLFLQVGAGVPPEFTHFPVDLTVICDGEVFQVNGVVDTKYVATNLSLVLSGKAKPEKMVPFENAVQRASALPHEEKIARILGRVWKSNFLPYWTVKKLDRSCGSSGGECSLRYEVQTGIDGIVAWDFIAPAGLDVQQLLARLGSYVTGEVIGIGRVRLENSQRAILLTVSPGGTNGR